MTSNRRSRPILHSPLANPERRRALLGITGCAAGALAAPDALAQAAACLLTQDAGEGPFYFDPSLLRSDITDDAAGAPLDIAIRVNGASDCGALAAVRVDLWQADGVGLYSGYREQQGVGGISTAPAIGQTYLRGTQFTDGDGLVRFRTIYPSWYGGRTPHLHFKVFVGDEEVIASQLFFPDEVNAEVFGNWNPYREHVAKRRVFNRNDPFIDAGGDGRTDGAFCEIERYDAAGLAASAVVTVRDA
jgi:protocatechuate 3,4-dioxygenase beta subunit